MATEWSIRKKQGACALCGRDFEHDERLLSFLCVEEGEIARRDVCQPCRAANAGEATLAQRWTAPGADGKQPLALYWWSTRHRADRRPTFQLDLDLIERLFLDLEGRAEEKLRELRYLLCLLLMRKRRVKLTSVRRGPDGEALVVHRPRHTERLIVHVHDFRADRMEELRARLQALLEGVEPEALEDAPPGEPRATNDAGAEPGTAGEAVATSEAATDEAVSEEAEEPQPAPGSAATAGPEPSDEPRAPRKSRRASAG